MEPEAIFTEGLDTLAGGGREESTERAENDLSGRTIEGLDLGTGPLTGGSNSNLELEAGATDSERTKVALIGVLEALEGGAVDGIKSCTVRLERAATPAG
jgi:hypothetical protein